VDFGTEFEANFGGDFEANFGTNFKADFLLILRPFSGQFRGRFSWQPQGLYTVQSYGGQKQHKIKKGSELPPLFKVVRK
jgi:hypothetical protein